MRAAEDNNIFDLNLLLGILIAGEAIGGLQTGVDELHGLGIIE